MLPPPTTGLRVPLLQGEGKGDDADVEAGGVDSEDDEEENEEKEKKKGPSVGRLLALSRPERGLILAGTVALFLSSLSTMVLPSFIGKLIDDVGGEGGGTYTFGGLVVGKDVHHHQSSHPLLIYIHPGDKGPAEARHSLDTSTGTLLAILLIGSLFTFIRGVCFNLGQSNGGGVGRGSAGIHTHTEVHLRMEQPPTPNQPNQRNQSGRAAGGACAAAALQGPDIAGHRLLRQRQDRGAHEPARGRHHGWVRACVWLFGGSFLDARGTLWSVGLTKNYVLHTCNMQRPQ